MTKLYKVTVPTKNNVKGEIDIHVLAKNAADASTIYEAGGERLEVLKVEKMADRVLDRRVK